MGLVVWKRNGLQVLFGLKPAPMVTAKRLDPDGADYLELTPEDLELVPSLFQGLTLEPGPGKGRWLVKTQCN
jgi:hypothetical protein